MADDAPSGHSHKRQDEPPSGDGPEGKQSIRNPETGTRLSALEIHENIRAPAVEEMERPASSLFFSSLAAGMLIAFSFLASGYVHSFVPEPYTDAAITLVYPLGFLFVVIGRSELFTENTLEPVIPLLHNKDLTTFKKMMRLWGILIIGNLLGALLVAWIAGRTGMVEDKLGPHLQEVAKNATEGGFGTVFYKAIFAGWLIALLAWLLAATQDTIAQITLIWFTTAPIHAFHFRHSIAGSVEAFYRAVTGTAPWGEMLGDSSRPPCLGMRSVVWCLSRYSTTRRSPRSTRRKTECVSAHPRRKNRNYVGMLELRGQLYLAAKTFRVYLGGQLARQHIDYDLAPQCGLLGEKYARHSSAVELTLDGVGMAQCFFEPSPQFRHRIIPPC